MTVFDLLFLAAALTSVTLLITVVALALRGRGVKAGKLLRAWGIAAALYLVVSLGVSYARPPRILRVGEPWCFDDWCLAVDKVSQVTASQDAYRVDLRIFSRAGRVTQRAKGAWIYLIDERGRRFAPQTDPAAVPLDVVLRPKESVGTSRVFQVPSDVHTLGLVTGHGGPYCGAMSVLIIGEGGCWFGQPAMVRIR